jgi:GT2 family glycosyltransferase
LLVNPDVLLSRRAFQTLSALLDEHRRIAACAPALTNPDGSTQVGSAGYLPSVASVTRHAFALTHLSGGGGRSLFVPARAAGTQGEFRSVDWLSAACLMVRRRAFADVGGFDERFFLYGEDIDLGKRLRARGWEMAYVPGVSVEHEHLQADRRLARRAPDGAWLDGLDLYYRLHTPRARRLLHVIGGAGFALRALAHSVRPGDRAHRRAQRDRMLDFMRRSARHAVNG